MDTVIYWAQLEKDEALLQAVGAFQAGPDTFMILEKLPVAWLDDEARQTGMRFEPFKPGEAFNQWERGRIFNHKGELRWEKIDGVYWVVYVGHDDLELPEGFSRDEELDLSEPVSESYYLWGRRLPDRALEILDRRPTANLFAEFTGGGILAEYPVDEPEDDNARQVVLKVIEYRDPRTHRRVYYRFQGVGWDESV